MSVHSRPVDMMEHFPSGFANPPIGKSISDPPRRDNGCRVSPAPSLAPYPAPYPGPIQNDFSTARHSRDWPQT